MNAFPVRVAKVCEGELNLFKAVVAIFAKHGVPVWLDQGSLLGAVRDGAFFSHDHDIDLGIRHNDLHSQFRTCVRDIRRLGAKVKVYPYAIKIFPISTMGEVKEVDIRIYREEGEFAYTEFRLTEPEKLNAMPVGKKLISKCASGLQHVGFALMQNSTSEIPLGWKRARLECRYEMGAILSYLGCQWRDVIKRKVIFRVPARFFQELGVIEIYGAKLAVPSEVEEYLEFKYGAGWRTPNRNWVYWKDDGAAMK